MPVQVLGTMATVSTEPRRRRSWRSLRARAPQASRTSLWLGLLFVAVGGGAQLPESAQPPEPSEQPGDQRSNVVEIDSTASPAPSQAEVDSGAVTPRAAPSIAIPTIELERLRNELRSEILEYRGKFIDYVLWFFGIVLTVGVYFAFGRFRQIEKDAKTSLDEIRGIREQAGKDAQRINERLEAVTAEGVEREPNQAKETAAEVRADPNAPVLDKAIARAVAHQQQGRLDKAIELWRAIARISETEAAGLAARACFSAAYLLQVEAAAFRTRGEDQTALGREQNALANYDKAIELDPKSLPAYVNRGIAKSKLGRHEDALADYDRAIEIDPNDASAYVNRGNAKSELDRHEDALADYDRAIEIDPNHANAYFNRGNAKSELGRHEDALADYDKAIQLEPNLATAYLARGNVRALLGRHDEAKADHNKALDLDPGLDPNN